ncbi:tetrapyrrole biosynthesis, uroporphyrinogen III synthase [Choiromyces venosus 120613-1]|uniref:Tetrapyrrole biosynthesis, uroporphyrinogen III synthase n=1 Tax=Choiromyces venosus 120613-1 TaxID=1336337 RepID=A0A3N4JA17_9PEZI|nr:tetrapyrrole biosynthesis, uroporphyrinogen III synthase [Choiromyces venosus 120613-1]
METKNIPILFLKTRSQPHEQYHEYFTSNPLDNAVFKPLFIPVLKHHHINLDTLKIHLTTKFDPADPNSYGGLVITSQRTVEALSSVIPTLPPTTLQNLFANTKVWVVGPATGSALTGLGFTASNVLGQDSDNGETLAELILESYESRPKPLLFLAGETRRDIIPKTLSTAPGERHIAVDTLTVYETIVDEGFETAFGKAIEETGNATRWIVLFSPAGADIAVGVLTKHLASSSSGSYLAVIGPTTGKHLVDKLSRRPDVVAEKPTPQWLWEGIRAFTQRDGIKRDNISVGGD